jgi:hypothetical protein
MSASASRARQRQVDAADVYCARSSDKFETEQQRCETVAAERASVARVRRNAAERCSKQRRIARRLIDQRAKPPVVNLPGGDR